MANVPINGFMPGMDMSGVTPLVPLANMPMPEENMKPSCGSTGPGQDYDLPLHVGALCKRSSWYAMAYN
jgi:hypothetical protein